VCTAIILFNWGIAAYSWTKLAQTFDLPQRRFCLFTMMSLCSFDSMVVLRRILSSEPASSIWCEVLRIVEVEELVECREKSLGRVCDAAERNSRRFEILFLHPVFEEASLLAACFESPSNEICRRISSCEIQP
jgi:hypothetical protein